MADSKSKPDKDEDDEALKPGDVLRGKYRIKRVLGEGGMGRVVRATHLKLDQDVAIKMLKRASTRNDRVVARFAREARAAARLKGEHVVRILDVDEEDREGGGGAPFIVMEYLDGVDLDRLVRKRGPLTPTRAVELALEACEGLAEAHSLGIVHRDVKPANLYLAITPGPRGGEKVKLLDFGISKAPETSNDPTITEADRILGSPSFMSPEQLKAARDVDARTDIWSLGVVLYFLLSGRLPFEGDSATSVAARIASEEPKPIDDLPDGLFDVVLHCLEKDPDKRFGSVSELARDLAPFAPEGTTAARRVSSVLRMPVAAPAPSGGPMASARSLTTADSHRTKTASGKNQRVTASLSDLGKEEEEQEEEGKPDRLTQSVDAGAVSIGGSTADEALAASNSVDRRERTTASSHRKASKRATTWLVMIVLAIVAAGIAIWKAQGSQREPAPATPVVTNPSPSSPPPPPATSIPVAIEEPPSPSAQPSASAAPSTSSAPRVVVTKPTPTPTPTPTKAAAPSASTSTDPLKLDLK